MSRIQKQVWHFNDADVLIYLEESDFYSASGYGLVINEEGETVPDFEVNLPFGHDSYVAPLFSYCFLQSCEIRESQTIARKQIPGRKHEMLRGGPTEHSMSIEHLYFDKDDEMRLEDVFKPNQMLRVALRFRDYAKREEPIYHVLKHVKHSGFSINGRDNDTVTVSVNFSAEEHYIIGGYQEED